MSLFRRHPEPVPPGPVVEKRRVTMRSDSGHAAIDYVPLDLLDSYVADAKTRWHQVTVGTSHDPGPAGDFGPTHYPPHLTRGDRP